MESRKDELGSNVRKNHDEDCKYKQFNLYNKFLNKFMQSAAEKCQCVASFKSVYLHLSQ